MAIAFELVADFGCDKRSANSCCEWLVSRVTPIEIDEYTIRIHAPFVSGYPYSNPTLFQVSVVPANVGCGVALDGTNERLQLNDAQLSHVGNCLYGFLRGAPHYQLAMVGWDVDFLLDVDSLNSDWASEISGGSFAGLVANKALIAQLPRSSYFVDFDHEHLWLPYLGSNEY